MTLITLLIVLSIERVAASSNVWQFEFYYLKMKNLLLKHFGKPGWLTSSAGMWIWLLLPVLLVQFIAGSIDWLLFEMAFNILVLLLCIGCVAKRKVYKSFLNAAARNDEEACAIYSAQLQGIPVVPPESEEATTEDEPQSTEQKQADSGLDDEKAQSTEQVDTEQVDTEQASQTTEQTKEEDRCGCETLGLTLVWYNFRYYCAVLFWFVALGPAGAVLYCVVRETADDSDETVQRIAPSNKIAKILHILDWLPARICSAGYLLIGNFNKAASIWLSYLLDLTSPAKSLVTEISQAAEPMDVVDCSKTTEAACMLKLAKRNILFFLALVALLTLYGGIR